MDESRTGGEHARLGPTQSILQLVHDDRHLPTVVQGYVAGRRQRDSGAGPSILVLEVPLRPPCAGVGRVQAALVDGGCQLIGEGEGVVRHARCLGQGGQHQGWQRPERAVGWHRHVVGRLWRQETAQSSGLVKGEASSQSKNTREVHIPASKKCNVQE